MVPLARKTLLHEWRRYLPAALAVAFTGVLLLMQAALVMGIFGGASVYVNQSGGDLWVGYPGTQTIELAAPFHPTPSSRCCWILRYAKWNRSAGSMATGVVRPIADTCRCMSPASIRAPMA